MAGMAMAAVMTLATVAPVRAAEAASSAAAASCSYNNNAASAMAGWRMRSSSCRSSGELETSRRELGWSGSSWSGDVLMQCGGKSGAVSRRMRATVEAKQGDELSYVMVKPDGVQRGLVGEIISRFEKKGFKLRGLKLFQTPQDLAEEHYAELKERPFFPKLVQYIVSGPVVAMAWEGPGVVASARKIIGVTNPLLAEPGTIRGDFGIEVGRNVVHGSDSAENGLREVALWFKEGELVEWDPELTPWLRE